MNKHTSLIFMGPSGSGKGTQISLLKQYLADNNQSIHRFETGAAFRELIKNNNPTGKRLKTIVSDGELVPDAITSWMFVQSMVDGLSENDVLLMDGYPRTEAQAQTVIEVLAFYKREQATIINIKVSESEVQQRLLERGRSDDTIEKISNRLHWYRENVVPTIDLLRNHDNFNVIDIQGEAEIDNIHKDIITKLTQ